MTIRYTLAEERMRAHGWTEPLHGPLPNKAEAFDLDLEGSYLLLAAKARLAELGWLDEDGKARFDALAAIEREAKPLRDAVRDWIDEVGEPEAPEYDSEEDWREWDEQQDWRKSRW